MSSPATPLALRGDLIHRRVWMGSRPVWVVKDPLAATFFYFSDQEFEILKLADGSRTLEEICATSGERFAPQYISPESLVRFFADARKRGLVVVNGAALPLRDQPDDLQRRWWRNPLAIRVPGFNPDRLLDAVLPSIKFLFSPWSLLLALLMMAVALVMVARDFDLFALHTSIATGRLSTGNGIVMLVVVLSLTKMIHELAHAFACKYFGGECRQIGVMFLVGVPCLYCDVSDAWMLDKRWKRILVSAAGMISEMVLASIATFLWLAASDGPVRDLSVTVMIVCSVTTVLFNGNPLLRYDGYYILSDLVGIPNLAGESAAAIRGRLRRFLWATPIPALSQQAPRQASFVVVYGIVSGLYRTAVYLLILLMLYRIADHYGFGGPAGTLGLFLVSLIAFRWCKSILAPPDRAVRRASLSNRRPLAIVTGFLMAVVLLGLVPAPRSVVAPMSIQPADARPVFVTGEGAIADAVVNGADVRAGQTIATLRNPGVDRQLLSNQTRCDRLAVELESLRKRRSASPEVSSRIPLIEKTHEEAVKQQQLRQKLAGRLTLTAPISGRVFAPPQRHESSVDQRESKFWCGTPFQPANRGAWLAEGTIVCVVGDPTHREAIVMLRQQDVELIETGQRVSLRLADRRDAVEGRVMEVAATPIDQIPAELRRGGLIPPLEAELQNAPYYQVRVSLEETADPLPVRLTGHAKITVRNASIFARIGRFLSDTFG